MEASTLAQEQTRKRNGMQAPVQQVSFPFQAAFQKVEQILMTVRSLPSKRGFVKQAAMRSTKA
jgi:hypothetical protein